EPGGTARHAAAAHGRATPTPPRAREKHARVRRGPGGGGEPPLLVQCADEQMQSRFVAQRILELREQGIPLNDMAVLFRSSFHSFDLELELQRHDVPFVKRGGFQFIATAHVKDGLAHLPVLVNPRRAGAWHRVLCRLDGLGPRPAEDSLRHLADVADVADAAARLVAYPKRGAYQKELVRLAELVRAGAGDGVTPGEQVARVVSFYLP